MSARLSCRRNSTFQACSVTGGFVISQLRSAILTGSPCHVSGDAYGVQCPGDCARKPIQPNSFT